MSTYLFIIKTSNVLQMRSDSCSLFDILQITQSSHNLINLLCIVHKHLYSAFKDAPFTFHFKFADIYLMQLRYDLCHLVQQAKFVKPFDIDSDRE